MRIKNLCLVALMLVPMGAAAQNAIRAGEYEIEMHIDLPGDLPGERTKASDEAKQTVLDLAGFTGEKRRECLSPEEVNGPNLVKMFASATEDSDCKLAEPKTVGNKLTLISTCTEDGVAATWTTELTFGTDSFSTVTKGKDAKGKELGGGRFTAKRIGDCRK